MTWADRTAKEKETPRSAPAPRKARATSGSRGEKYVHAALESECETVRNAGKGERNNTLNVAALKLGSLVPHLLDEGDVRSALLAAARACGLGESESKATIESGLKAGMKEPRDVPPPRSQSNGHADHSHEPWNPTDDDAPNAPPDTERNEATSKPEPLPLVPLVQLLGPALDRAERRRTGLEVPVPVPFRSYAEALGGGFWAGAHFIVSGTGVGKSQLTIQTALGAAAVGIPAMYIGLELDEMQLALRVLGEHTGTRWSNLYLGHCSEAAIAQARSSAAELAGLPFYVDFGPPQGWPVSRLYGLAESLRAKHPAGPMLIVLDYLQLVGADAVAFERRPDLRERIGSAAYAAKAIANRFDASVVVVSSAARSHYGLLASDAAESGLITRQAPGHFEPIRTIAHPHTLVGLGKESGEVEYSADTVTTLIRWPEPLDNGETAVICAVPKVRAGVPRWFAMAFSGSFTELPVRDIGELPGVPKKGRPAVDDDDIEARVLATLRRLGPVKTKRKVVENTKGDDRKIYAAIKDLVATGRIEVSDDGTLTAVSDQESQQ